jgi:ABC-type Fe3+/spermidine/putrescine transport system ATPase subunit
VLAVRPENLSLTGAGGNVVEGRVRLSAYLGNTLRYEVETAPGLLLQVDVRDPWHHETLAPGHPVRVGFPSSVALMLRDE